MAVARRSYLAGSYPTLRSSAFPNSPVLLGWYSFPCRHHVRALCVLWLQGVKHMWQTDGLKGLFKGNGLNCIRIFPNSAIKFLCYEQITRWADD